MCLISKEIKAVSGTNLFCGVNSEKTRQITVYANTVDNISKNNAMVLPVPFPNSVVFHNLEKYKNFFTDCENCFVSKTNSYYLSNSFDSLAVKESLKVFNVGSYKVSLANSLDDLKRINTSVFDLSKGLEKVLNEHYSNPIFGFIICKLSDGNDKYHPFAYSHDIAQEKVFIPTRHYHDENNNNFYKDYDMFSHNRFNASNINNSPMFSSWNLSNNTKNDKFADDWSHDIYLYNIDVNTNSTIRKMNSCNETWTKNVKINFDKLDFPLDKQCRSFQKINITGNHPNLDIILTI